MKISEFGKNAVEKYKAGQRSDQQAMLELVTKWLRKIGIDEIPAIDGSSIMVGTHIRIQGSCHHKFFSIQAEYRTKSGARFIDNEQLVFYNPDQLKQAIEKLYIWIDSKTQLFPE